MDTGRFLLDVGLVSFIVFILLTATGPITGFLTVDKAAELSVQNESGITVSRFALNQIITLGNSTTISVEITNSGSNTIDPISFKLEIFQNDTNTWEYFSPETSLHPGEFFGRNFRHTPQETGIHTVNLVIDFEGNTLQTTGVFRVDPRPGPVGAGGTITIVRKQIRFIREPAPEQPPPPSRSWNIHFPREINLSQGTTGTAAIGVENTGEAPLRNVRIMVQTPANISADYNPKIMFEVPPGQTQNFMLSLTPDNTTLGQHEMVFRLTSDTFSREGRIDVSVSPTATVESLRQEIRSIRLMMADAEAQKRIADGRGFDVGNVEAALNSSRESLRRAETFLDAGNLGDTRESLDSARESVERAYQLLFIIRGQQVSVRAPLVPPIYLLVVVSVLVGLILVASYYYVLEKQTKRPALLREEE